MKRQPRNSSYDDLPIFVQWMGFLEWFLPVTEGFPKRVRFTFSDRMVSFALDVVEDLIEARYSRDKNAYLKSANLRLEKLRVMLRLSHSMRYLGYKQYEYGVKQINEVGKMLGGWMRQQRG